jgi:hypothetical protein
MDMLKVAVGETVTVGEADDVVVVSSNDNWALKRW